MARTYNVSFNIQGALDGSLLAALRNASQAMRGLGNAARAASASARASQAGLRGLSNSLNSIQAAAQKFRALQDALRQTTANINQSGVAFNEAKAKYQADAQAVDQLRQKLAQLNTELGKARQTKIVQSDGVKAVTADLQALKRAFDIARQAGDTVKMTSLAAQINQTQAALLRQKQTAREAAAAFKELSDKVKQTKADLKAAQDAARASGQTLSRTQNETRRLAQSYQQQLAALRQLTSTLSAAGFNVSNFSASEARLESEINRVNAALERQTALTNAQRSASEASQNMFNAYNNFQGALQTVGQMAAPFKAAVDTAIDFEHAMSRVKALTQSQNIREGRTEQVNAEMKLLTQQARDLGATTMFTSTQAAQAMGYLGMAGWKTQQIYATMPGMLDLAAAAGADLAQTADIVSDNMTAMGVPVNQAAHFMDVYAFALTNSNARLSDFGETMKYAAPVAKAYGATLDETAAMVMMMANAGIKGSMAGTSLRMGLLRLAGPPKTATKEMAKLGLSLSDAQAGALEAEAVIKGLGIDLTGATSAGDKMTRVLMQLHEKTKGLSQDEKLAAFKGIFGVNAETGWLALFDQGPEVFLKYLEGLRSADGYAGEVAKTMLDDTQGALTIMESAWDAFKERVGEALTPSVRAAAGMFTPLITSAAQWIEQNPAIVQGAAAIAAALGGIIVTAAAVSLAFAGWKFIVTQIGLVSAALSSLGSGALLGGLIGRLAALRTALFGLGGAATLGGWGAMFGAIAARATAAAVAVRTFFASLTLGGMASGVVGVLQSIGTAIAGAARAAFAFAFSPVGVALMALALAGLYCYQNWEKVAPVLSNIANIITGALSGALQTLQPAIENLMSAFDNLAGNGALSQLGMLAAGALATVATAIAGILATIINVGSTILSTIMNVISGVVNLINSVLVGDIQGAFESMKSIATSAFEGIGQVASGILDGILSTVKAIGEAWDFIRGKSSVPHGDESHGGSGGTFDIPSAPAQEAAPVQTIAPVQTAAPAPETPAIDTSATQAALDAVGDSATNAATQMDGVNQAAQSVTQAGEAFSQLPAAVQPAADAVTQMSTSLTAAGTEAQNLSTSMQAGATSTQSHTSALDANAAALQANIGALNAFGAACNGAVGGVTALGSAASSAAGSVSGLGSAAQAACAQLAAAGANAASAVNAAVASMPAGGAPVAANAEGGIYRKGAFLTTFAERSPEAAIPLDNSQRARDLWTQAGVMLGILPQVQAPTFDPTITTPPTIPDTYPRGQEISARRAQPSIVETLGKVFGAPTLQLPNLDTATTPPFVPEGEAPVFKPTITTGQDVYVERVPRRRRRQPSGQRPPVRMPQRRQPSIAEALGKIFGGGLIGQRPIFNARIDPLTTTTTIPRIDIPAIAAPQIESPTLNAPQLPSMEVPTLNAPTVPSMGVPTLNAPQLPSMEVPTLNAPTVPSMGVPTLNAPTVPSMEVPTLNAPQLLSMGVPTLNAPTVPSVQLGGLAGDIPNQIITTHDGLLGGLKIPAPVQAETSPTIQLTVNVTINGQADESAVRRGVESAAPTISEAVMDGWARARDRERLRRSYA